MSKSSGSERRVLADGILVRLTPQARAALSTAAAAEGMSDAAWARSRLVGLLGLDPQAEAQPTRRYEKPNFRVPDFVGEMARLREAIGEATGALTKSSVFLREEGRPEAHALIEALLPVYRQAALDWDAVKKSYVDAYRAAHEAGAR